MLNKSLISSLYNSKNDALTKNYLSGVPSITLKTCSKVLGIIPLRLGDSEEPSIVNVLPVPVYP